MPQLAPLKRHTDDDDDDDDDGCQFVGHLKHPQESHAHDYLKHYLPDYIYQGTSKCQTSMGNPESHTHDYLKHYLQDYVYQSTSNIHGKTGKPYS